MFTVARVSAAKENETTQEDMMLTLF
jgi:hypothetical protein